MLHNIRITTERPTSVHPFAFIKSRFAKCCFLVNFTPIEHKLLHFGRYRIPFYLKQISHMVRVTWWWLKGEELILFPFLESVHPNFQTKSDKPDRKIRFIILWLPHIYISFLLQIYEKNSYYPQNFLKCIYLWWALIQNFSCYPSKI